jgi:transposase
VGIEACGGAHHRVRKFEGFGHDVRLMSPHFVTSNKNDTGKHRSSGDSAHFGRQKALIPVFWKQTSRFKL